MPFKVLDLSPTCLGDEPGEMFCGMRTLSKGEVKEIMMVRGN
jgi:hypothetical protein